MSAHKLAVRLRPTLKGRSGDRFYTKMSCPGFPINFRFSEREGWYQIQIAVAEVLRHEQDTAGVAIFDVMTRGEAVLLEKQEEEAASKRVSRASARNPHDVRIMSAKRAQDLPAEPEPERVAQAQPRQPLVPVAQSDVDWDALGEASEDPAETGEDEDEEAAARALGIEMLNSPREPEPEPEPEAPVRRSGARGKRTK